MNVARIACAFGNAKELELLIQRIRDASNITKRLCGIILETHGTSAMVGPVIMTPSKQNNNNNNNNNSNNNNKSDNIEPISSTDKKEPQSNDKKDIDDLRILAQTLNINLDALPQNIISNASFAVDYIIDNDQNNDNNVVDDTKYVYISLHSLSLYLSLSDYY